MNKNHYTENTVTLMLPKDITKLEEKYAEVLAEIIAEMLSVEELEYLIN